MVPSPADIIRLRMYMAATCRVLGWFVVLASTPFVVVFALDAILTETHYWGWWDNYGPLVLSGFPFLSGLLVLIFARLAARVLVPFPKRVLCPKCDYAVDGATHQRCPECGLFLGTEFSEPADAPGPTRS
ncbi:MAG: hypothetical protein RBS39_07940 [Phycisphaerales bacterium]|jgi:hypothetical protein|nr:hypothetical protein [Phycisphaerales bacterium]